MKTLLYKNTLPFSYIKRLINPFYKLSEQYKYPFYNSSKKNFTSSTQKQIDVDKIFEKANKQKKQLEELRKNLDENKFSENEDKKEIPDKTQFNNSEESFITIMWRKRLNIQKANTDIETKLHSRLDEYLAFLGKNEMTAKTMSDFGKKMESIEAKRKASLNEYNEKHKHGESIESVKDLIGIEERRFKTSRQAYQKAEEDVDKNLRALSKFPLDDKNKYEEERSKWKEEIIEDIRNAKKVKDEYQKELVSNLEKPSEIAQDLIDQSGLDNTGGDE
jgi:hypothetical protein